MPRQFAIANLVRRADTIQYGQWDAFAHPTGQSETIPLILASGRRSGPCLWLTAGMHGPEHSGPLVIHRLLTSGFTRELRGTVVAVPALTPAGLRTGNRVPYHSPDDPNRLWPDGRPAAGQDPDRRPPTPQEELFRRLFEQIQATADLAIDLHNAWAGSIPFSLIDRVLYRADTPGDRRRAQDLAVRLEAMAEAIGLAVVREFPGERYLDDKLHRSTSGACVQLAGIPALTIELGGGLRPDPAIEGAAVAGLRNLMRWAGMLAGPPEPLPDVRRPHPAFPCRRSRTPRTPVSGLAHCLVSAGDLIRLGDPVAQMVDVWGRPLLDQPLRAEADGYVLGLSEGIVFYPGDSVATLAIRDAEPLVFPYPRAYFSSRA